MKFLVPNYSCLQNPWLGATAPRSPSLCPLSSTEFVEHPRTKFLGTLLVPPVFSISLRFIRSFLIFHSSSFEERSCKRNSIWCAVLRNGLQLVFFRDSCYVWYGYLVAFSESHILYEACNKSDGCKTYFVIDWPVYHIELAVISLALCFAWYEFNSINYPNYWE